MNDQPPLSRVTYRKELPFDQTSSLWEQYNDLLHDYQVEKQRSYGSIFQGIDEWVVFHRLKKTIANKPLQKAFTLQWRYRHQLGRKLPELSHALTYGIIAVCIGAILWSIHFVWHTYQESVYWDDHHQESLTLANQPPELLYDTDPRSRQAKKDFMKLFTRHLKEETGELLKPLSDEEADKMDRLLALIAEVNRPTYEKRLNALKQKSKLYGLYNDLFKEDTTLKESVKPSDIQTLNDKTWPEVEELLQANEDDVFAKSLYKKQQDLMADANAITQTLSQFESLYSQIDKDHLLVKPKGDLDIIHAALSLPRQLNYHWTSLDVMLQQAHALQSLLTTPTKKGKGYEAYQADQRKKQEAEQAIKKERERFNQEVQKDKEEKEQKKARQVTVPDILGKSLKEAQHLLLERKLSFTYTFKTDNAPKGTVIDMTPHAGEACEKGDSIQFVLSSGPDPDASNDASSDSSQASSHTSRESSSR